METKQVKSTLNLVDHVLQSRNIIHRAEFNYFGLLVTGLVMSLQMLQLEYNKTYEELTIILTQNLQTGNVLLLGQSGL